MDLMSSNPERKRVYQKEYERTNDSGKRLNFDNYRYPENHSPTNKKKLKLPNLLSSKLPIDIVNQFENDTDTSSSSITPSMHVNNNNIPVKPSSSNSITLITDYANELKVMSIDLFKSKDYMISILEFTQSYILFIFALRLKEYSNDNFYNNSTDNESIIKYLNKKNRDWINTLQFGEKIIGNFSKIIIEREKRVGTKDKKCNSLLYILGLIYYSNGLICLHICKNLSKHLNLIKNKNDKELIEIIDQMLKFDKQSKKCFENGEIRFGLFEIAREFPKLWTLSFTKLKSILRNEIIISYQLKIPNKNNKTNNDKPGLKAFKFKTGVNYILPICNHMWDLDMLINFAGYFLKEWLKLQNIKHSLVFAE